MDNVCDWTQGASPSGFVQPIHQVLEVDLQTQRSVECGLSIERLSTSVTNVNIGAVSENANLDERLQPVLDVAGESASELLVRQQTANGDASVVVLALVQLPAGAVQVADGSLSPSSPADRQLAASVLEPQHELLGVAGGGVTLGVGGHEIEANVALVGGGVGTGPVVGSRDRFDS